MYNWEESRHYLLLACYSIGRNFVFSGGVFSVISASKWQREEDMRKIAHIWTHWGLKQLYVLLVGLQLNSFLFSFFLKPFSQASFSISGWQLAEIPLWWQPTCRAWMVYPHHSDGFSKWSWRNWYWMGLQTSKLRYQRDCKQRQTNAGWLRSPSYGKNNNNMY